MMLTIKADGESSLSDVVAIYFGNMEALFELALLNGLDFDSVPELDAVIEIPELSLMRNTSTTNLKKPPVYPYVVAGGDQALIDLAIQEAGTMESLMELALLNGLSFTDDLTPGHEYVKPAVVDANIVAVFAGAMKPASNGPVDEEQLPAELEGIDYWFIENTFIVN